MSGSDPTGRPGPDRPAQGPTPRPRDDGGPGATSGATPGEASVRRRHLSLVWIIPVVALLAAGYLGVRALNDRGPLATITFNTADGLTANQTQVKHKAVGLGTVEEISLAKDLSHVIVKVRMNSQGEHVLTDHARFWVVKPRISSGSISGLETLVSGAFIAIDPGDPGGAPKTDFAGLEQPPGVRSDEPGHTYQLEAVTIGSLAEGTPIFYRDIPAGEVLGYDFGDGHGPVTITAFVRAPFDKFVHPQTHFWNASGLNVNLGANGLHVEVESLQAVISGAVSFDSPKEAWSGPMAPDDTKFHLFASKGEADAAGFNQRIPLVTYLQSSVAGLGVGSAVNVFGMQIGNVTDVKLLLDPTSGIVKVRVAMEIQPERVFPPDSFATKLDPAKVLGALVNQGMRAEVDTASYVTGEKNVTLAFVPNAKPAGIALEDGVVVLPGQGGGLDNVMGAVSDVAAKLQAIPFAQIGENANALIATLNSTIGGPEVKSTLRSLSATLKDAQVLVHDTDVGLQPTLKRLPELSAQLQDTLKHANAALATVGTSYGADSDFQRNLERVMAQASDAVRSVRLLADYLTRNPSALILGRTSQAGNR
ncbi:MAG: intermembrane transport protein PqiB [Janthinobacterium lividum]